MGMNVIMFINFQAICVSLYLTVYSSISATVAYICLCNYAVHNIAYAVYSGCSTIQSEHQFNLFYSGFYSYYTLYTILYSDYLFAFLAG